jgi:hypothetical protein
LATFLPRHGLDYDHDLLTRAERYLGQLPIEPFLEEARTLLYPEQKLCMALNLLDAVQRDFTLTYPRCTGGARACPPEDCGGVFGYADIVSGIMDKDTRAWLPPGYDPARFDPAAVRFDDPASRLAYAWYGSTEP